MNKKKALVNDILETLESVIFWIFVLRILFFFVIGIAQVDGYSMEPTLRDTQRLIYYHMAYKPQNNDIVIVESSALEKIIVKRVIATEGQTIDIDFSDGTVSVDGEVLDEPYINNATINNTGYWKDEEYPLTVPEGYVFVMGDNRQGSTDSRHWKVGFIPEDEVIGKVILRYRPISDFRIF